jgi:hypothetical protein
VDLIRRSKGIRLAEADRASDRIKSLS